MFNETLFRLKVNMMCGGVGGGGGGGGDAGSPVGSPAGPGASGGSGGNVGPGSGPGGGPVGANNSNLGVSTAGELGPADAGMGPGSPGGTPGTGPNGTDADFAGINSDIESQQTNFSAVQSDFDAINSETEATISEALAHAQAEPTSSKALETFFSYLGKSLQLIGHMVLGPTIVGLISKGLEALGVSAESAAAAATQIGQGADPSEVGNSLSGADMGGPAGNVDSSGNIGGSTGASGSTGGAGETGGTVATNDPLSYDFWNNFVDEWMGKNGKSAKTMYSEDDAFKKSKVEPAIGKYQAALADLTNQAQTGTGTFTPTTFGMGNFRSSFVPKSGHLTADKLKDYAKEGLTSELALTDVMQPNKGSMDYLTALQALAQFDKQAQLQKYGIDMGYNTAIDSIQEGQEDKGSWLDVIKDVVQIGDTVGDAWSKYF